MMAQGQEGLLQHSLRVAKRQLFRFGRYIRAVSTPLVEKLEPKLSPLVAYMTPYFQKTKEFYEKHQLLIFVAGAVVITYLVVRPAKEEEGKQKKKRGSTVRKQLGNRTFISDNSEADLHEEPSTGTRREVESSGRQVGQRKKNDNKYLERIQSSSEEEESGDKIFFEVYKTYQVSTNK